MGLLKAMVKISNKDFLELLKNYYFYKQYCGNHTRAEIENAIDEKWEKVKDYNHLWYIGDIRYYKARTHMKDKWEITSTLDLKHARVEMIRPKMYLVMWYDKGDLQQNKPYWNSCLYILEEEW